MRMMMRFSIPVERGNETIEDGSLEQTTEAIVSETKAEAAHFLLEGGERAGYIFFELEDAALLPKLNEMMFAALDAAIDVHPRGAVGVPSVRSVSTNMPTAAKKAKTDTAEAAASATMVL